MYSDIMVDRIYLLLWDEYYDLFLKINISCVRKEIKLSGFVPCIMKEENTW